MSLLMSEDIRSVIVRGFPVSIISVSDSSDGRKLLVLYSESGDLVKEGDVSLALAEIV